MTLNSAITVSSSSVKTILTKAFAGSPVNACTIVLYNTVVQLCHVTLSFRMNYKVRSQGTDQISTLNDSRANQLEWRSVEKDAGGVGESRLWGEGGGCGEVRESV